MATNKIALLKRKEKDVYKLRTSKFKIEQTQNESTFQVDFCGTYNLIIGPEGTIYELGRWKINLYLPEEYPYKSPSVGFINRIYHPNIDFSSGSVCLDVINQTWTPMYQLLNIFEVTLTFTQVFLPQLLTYPNPASPLNQEAAHLYQSQIEKYNEKVKEYINKYALNNELVQIRKKSEELLMIETQKSKEGKSKKQFQEQHSMEDEGSSMSDRNSIMDDQDLKLY